MTTASDDPLLRNLLLLPRLLRRLGVAVSLEQSLAFVRALELIDLGERREVYHAGRCLLVSRHEDLRLYDVVFHRLFGHHRLLEPRRGQPRRRPHEPDAAERRRPYDLRTWLAERAGAQDLELEVADRSGTFSASEVLQHKEFSAMTPEELERVRRLIGSLHWRMSERRTRRFEPRGRRGRLDLRRALRQAGSYGGIARLFWREPRVKERPVVLLADISGSMETVSRLVLQLFFSMTHGLRTVETFVFGTRLSRITPQMRLRNIDRALDEASRQVLDWAGGTRIGECLRQFNRRWARRVLRRGAVTVLVSDGWDRGDTRILRREMRHLQRRCHRLIWLNPLLGRATYEPRVEGMAAALPFVDDFLPIHNLDSLEQLAEHLASLPAKRGARRQTPDGGRESDGKPFTDAVRTELHRPLTVP